MMFIGSRIKVGLPTDNPSKGIRVCIMEPMGGKEDHLIKAVMITPGKAVHDLPRLKQNQYIKVTAIEP